MRRPSLVNFRGDSVLSPVAVTRFRETFGLLDLALSGLARRAHMDRPHVPRRLDHEAMHHAAQVLIGRHDFTTFRAAECQAASPVKTLDRLEVSRAGEAVVIRASARSFLHHQVRSITGSLKLVGEGKWSRCDLQSALEAQDRARCGAMAPSCGLYLVRVDYD